MSGSNGSGFAPIAPNIQQQLISALMQRNAAGGQTQPAPVVGIPGGPQQAPQVKSPVANEFMGQFLQGLFQGMGQPSQGAVAGAAADYTNPSNYGMASGTGTVNPGANQTGGQQMGGWLAQLMQNYLGLGGSSGGSSSGGTEQ